MSSSKYDYSDKLSKDNVEVILRCEAKKRSAQLTCSLSERSNRFGYSFLDWTQNTSRSLAGRVIRHLLYVIDCPYKDEIILECESLLDQFTSISVAFWYSTEQEMLNYRPMIEAKKRQLGDRINFLRPDVNNSDGVFVSDSKILENAICDTVRVKYIPERLSGSERSSLTRTQREFFNEASRLYRELSLWHRSPTDGYLALRTGPKSFLITGTKTDKAELDVEQISLVEQYRIRENVLVYCGCRLPSSDAVEAAIVFERCQHVGAIVHTHADRYFTRKPDYADKVLVGRLPYGEPELGLALAKRLATLVQGFLIMDDHGEVFFGRDPGSVFQCIREEVSLARSREVTECTL